MANLRIKFNVLLATLIIIMSCSNDDSETIVDEELSENPFQELYDQGIDQYLGTITPISTEAEGPVTEHIFSNEDGPVCFTGNQFSMFTRDGSNNNLLIFVQGGGICSPIACEAVEDGIPLIPFGILDPQDSDNPTFGYDLGYLPYCDGSLWMGDGSADSDGNGVNDRFFKGVQNLSASLDVVVRAYPSPDKIVLAGNSAGGFGVHVALPLVRKLYPEVRIDVINDSGIGILPPGGFDALSSYWNADNSFPASCTNCVGSDGNLTGYYKYQLEQDENTRMAFISSKQDATSSAAIGAAAFEAELIALTSELNTSYPDRFNSLIINGDEHTFIISGFSYTVSDFTVKDWVADMINEEDDDWGSFTE